MMVVDGWVSGCILAPSKGGGYKGGGGHKEGGEGDIADGGGGAQGVTITMGGGDNHLLVAPLPSAPVGSPPASIYPAYHPPPRNPLLSSASPLGRISQRPRIVARVTRRGPTRNWSALAGSRGLCHVMSCQGLRGS